MTGMCWVDLKTGIAYERINGTGIPKRALKDTSTIYMQAKVTLIFQVILPNYAAKKMDMKED